jgi:hypothetical protein
LFVLFSPLIRSFFPQKLLTQIQNRDEGWKASHFSPFKRRGFEKFYSKNTFSKSGVFTPQVVSYIVEADDASDHCIGVANVTALEVFHLHLSHLQRPQ